MSSLLSCCLKLRRKATKWKEIEGSRHHPSHTVKIIYSDDQFPIILETAADSEKAPEWISPPNSIMLQGFEWHVPADQLHWRRLEKALPSLKEIGVDNIWIPPGCKGMEPSGTGYDIYDLYDVGEFDQKGSRATRWGPKEDLHGLVHSAQDLNIGIIWDTVLNHKAGADFTEKFPAVKVDPEST